MANEIITAKNTKIASWLGTDGVQKSIASVIKPEDRQRFTASIVSAVQSTPALQECTLPSILSAAVLGESLNLPPSPQLGFFYMVPFKNTKKKCSEAVFVMGYKGYNQLAIRSGQYKKVVASEIREGELKSYNPITEDFAFEPITDIKERLSKPVIGYYAMIELVNGFRKEIFATKEEIEEHALKYSQGYRSDKRNKTEYTFWSTKFDEMAKKTLLRRLISKWGIMSTEMQKAYVSDTSMVDDDGSIKYPDNTIDIKADVAQDIQDNANSEDFIEAEIVEETAPLEEFEGDMPDFLKE